MSFESFFSADELILFFDPYFKRRAWESHYLEFESRTTHHWWMIIKDPDADLRYTLLHKHHWRHPYHLQKRSDNFRALIRHIKKHDKYVLAKHTYIE